MHADGIDLDTYRRLRAEARRHTRRAQEADDLVQDALLIGLEQNRRDFAWLSGVIRHRAAQCARSAIRERRREAAAAIEDRVEGPEPRAEAEASPAASVVLARLPPAARRVAVLALHGLNADEIRWVLSLSDTAFRQRLTSIRKAIGALPPPKRAEALALAYVRDPARAVELQFGLIRRALKAALGGDGGRSPGIGTHDVDGHLLIVRGRLVRGRAHGSGSRGNE